MPNEQPYQDAQQLLPKYEHNAYVRHDGLFYVFVVFIIFGVFVVIFRIMVFAIIIFGFSPPSLYDLLFIVLIFRFRIIIFSIFFFIVIFYDDLSLCVFSSSSSVALARPIR
ncbi:hypothetical protein J4727_07395 [Providencia rettgeri]|uniref:Uncharacterized protein n=1 Tax=Providencia rettgeri TaxID=587 RepID=A0A939NFA5_PRORE|nr:hypothetical protein [Providencia rettgeri]